MKQITSLKELCRAAMNKQAVVCKAKVPSGYTKYSPAEFVQNFPGAQIQRLLDKGMFIYEGKKPWMIVLHPDAEFEETQERLYWSNKQGWVDFDSCTRFTEIERQHLSLISGGKWTKGRFDEAAH